MKGKSKKAMNNKPYPQSLPHGFVLQGKRNAYIIECPLGQGAFGITYLAKYRSVVQGEMGSGSAWIQVCIKEFFMRELSSREEQTGSLHEATGNSLVSRYRKAFLREANNLARMQHPNIVNVFEVIEANNTAYIVMEYIDGGNLDDYIARKGRLSEDEALRLFQPICDAMCYMHARRMLHLDLKPKNVMLDEEGKPYLIDFGLSKQYTQDGEPESSTSIGLGTPGYAPSEQAEQRDGDTSFRATIDVYALGGTLYKMLTGETPPKASEILNDDELLSTNLQKAGVSDKLIEVVEKAMKPASGKRYQSVTELMEALYQSPRTIIEDTITETNKEEETIITAKDNVEKKDEPQKIIPLSPQSHFPKWLLPAIAGVVALVITFLSLRSCGKEEPAPSQANTSERQSNSTSLPLPTTHNGHEYVDLGLSVMWATCNVGATKPEEYGSYYAWGETATKSEYSWSTLKYLKSGNSESNVAFSKYSYNEINNKVTLDFSDDAASINWGDSWRTATDAEWTELAEKCIWTWTKQGDCYGYKVSSKSNGQFIFLPAAGCRFDTKEKKEFLGYYMSSSLCENDAKKVWYMRFNTKAFHKDDGYRYYGYSVRPVYSLSNSNEEESGEVITEKEELKYGSLKVTSEPSGAAIYLDGKLLAGKTTPELLEILPLGSHKIRLVFEGYEEQTKTVTIKEGRNADLAVTLKAKPAALPIQQQSNQQTAQQQNQQTTQSKVSTNNGHEYIDLGLSVMWATCNIGASSPSAYGNYYAWGETTTRSDYSWETLRYRTSGDSYDNLKFSKYVTQSDRGPVDNKTVLEMSDDAARQNWGGSWRMPTDAEWNELRGKCTWTWTSQGGHNGYKVTSRSNGNSIFLPAAGYRGGTYLSKEGSNGYYWSSSLSEGDPGYAWDLDFYSGFVSSYDRDRYYGHTVRPVCRP